MSQKSPDTTPDAQADLPAHNLTTEQLLILKAAQAKAPSKYDAQGNPIVDEAQMRAFYELSLNLHYASVFATRVPYLVFLLPVLLLFVFLRWRMMQYVTLLCIFGVVFIIPYPLYFFVGGIGILVTLGCMIGSFVKYLKKTG